MLKKSVSIILAILMLISVFAVLPLTANAEDEAKVTLTSKQGFFDDYTKTYKKGDTFYVKIKLQSQKLLYHNQIYLYFDHNKLRCADLELTNGEGVTAANISEELQKTKDRVTANGVNSEGYDYKEGNTYVLAKFDLLDASSPVSIEFDAYLLTIIMDENKKESYEYAIYESVVDNNYSDYYNFSLEDSGSEVLSGTTGDCKWEYSPSYATLKISGNGNMQNYTKVSERPWHSYVSDISKIVIADGVKNIGTFAFKDAKVKKVVIPDSVTEIGETAFFGCSSLEDVSLGTGLKTIGEYAFADTALDSVSIPPNVENLGQYCFGYKNDTARYIYVPVTGFEIFGYNGSAAENYADKNGFTFSALDEETTEPDTTPETPVYIVAGNETEIFKSTWDSQEESNLMTLRSDGKYAKTYEVDRAYDGVQLKVACNGNWYGNKYNNNIYIDLTEAGSFTVVFNPETKEITLEGSIVQPHKIVVNNMYAIGAGSGNFLNNHSWDFDDSNIMTEVKPGVYEITYENVDAYFDYNFKFAADGKWNDNWGAENDDTINANTETKAFFNKANIHFDVENDNSKVTLRLDLTGFNAETSDGAKFTVILNNNEVETLPDAPEETTGPDLDEPTKPVETTAPAEDKPTEPVETTAPAEDKPTAPLERTQILNYIPDKNVLAKGNKITITVQKTNGDISEYVMTPTGEKRDGVPVYTAEIPDGSDVYMATIRYYNGETFIGQFNVSGSQIKNSEGKIITSLGTVYSEKTDKPKSSTKTTTKKSTTKTKTAKKKNTLTVKAKTKTIKLKKLKKKNQTVKPLTVKKAKGKVTYKLIKKGTNKKIYKYLKISKKGAITIKKWKKAKKGSYKVKVQITAKGNKSYKPKSITKVFKIKVK